MLIQTYKTSCGNKLHIVDTKDVGVQRRKWNVRDVQSLHIPLRSSPFHFSYLNSPVLLWNNFSISQMLKYLVLFCMHFLMLLLMSTAEKVNGFYKRNSQFLIRIWLNLHLGFSASVSVLLRNLFLSWVLCSRVFYRQMFAVLCCPFLSEFWDLSLAFSLSISLVLL